MNSSKRGFIIAPCALVAGLALGGCSLASEELDEQTSHAEAIAAKAKEMAAQQRLETKGAAYGGGYGAASPYDNPYVDDPYVDNPYVDDPYVVDTPGEALAGPGPYVGGPVGRSYVERGPGYVVYVSCDGFGTCVRRSESYAGYASGYGYGYGY